MSEAELTRREWMARGAGAVVVAGATVTGAAWLYDPTGRRGLHSETSGAARLRNYFADVGFPTGRPRISVATGAESRMERMVRAAITGLDPELGMKRFIGPGDVVLIKPNVGFDRPSYLGATTHPEVLRWIIRLCREAGARRIDVTDNPIEAPEACFARSGMRQVARDEGAGVILPARHRFSSLLLRDRAPDVERAEALGRWPVLYAPLAEATKLIGVAPVKDHNLCSASMGMKNWYGLLGGRRNQFHQAIHQIVSDLGMIVSPTLIIADATRVMMRNGPTGGRISDVRPGGALNRPTVIASVDPVACDSWCYEHLLGRDPARLTYLELAHEKIRRRIEAGETRFGARGWRDYERSGKIAWTNV